MRTQFAMGSVSNQETAMADDKQAVGRPDRDRVDMDDPSEVTQVATKLGTSAQAVREAIKRVGPMRADVERELSRQKDRP
jgi:hypothetical protein